MYLLIKIIQHKKSKRFKFDFKKHNKNFSMIFKKIIFYIIKIIQINYFIRSLFDETCELIDIDLPGLRFSWSIFTKGFKSSREDSE